jgi:hypothetical protein
MAAHFLGVGMILAAGAPGGTVAEAVLLPIEVAALNVTLVGIEYIAQGQNRRKEEIEIDPFPIIPTPNHLQPIRKSTMSLRGGRTSRRSNLQKVSFACRSGDCFAAKEQKRRLATTWFGRSLNFRIDTYLIQKSENREEGPMLYLLFIEIVGYFGILWVQGAWYKHNELTENRFALLQVAYFSLLTLTGTLMVSTTSVVTFLGIGLALLWWIVGYPLARWVYRQMF